MLVVTRMWVVAMTLMLSISKPHHRSLPVPFQTGQSKLCAGFLRSKGTFLSQPRGPPGSFPITPVSLALLPRINNVVLSAWDVLLHLTHLESWSSPFQTLLECCLSVKSSLILPGRGRFLTASSPPALHASPSLNSSHFPGIWFTHFPTRPLQAKDSSCPSKGYSCPTLDLNCSKYFTNVC